MNYGSIVSELFRDWRSTNPGAADIVTGFNEYVYIILGCHDDSVRSFLLIDDQIHCFGSLGPSFSRRCHHQRKRDTW